MYMHVENVIKPHRYDGCSGLYVSVDPFNMARNAKIIMVMLCLTILVHLTIYNREIAKKRRAVVFRPASGHVSVKGVANNSRDELEREDDNQITESKEVVGDGELYKLIEYSAKPFLDGYAKQLIILGYQRVGSSFFGQIFDGNPSFYYIYEPLDSVYGDMYGTPGGQNVPSDITYLPNGNPREIPEEERTAVGNLLVDILNCRVEKLSPGFLMHKYWFLLTNQFMKSWMPYKECLLQYGVLEAREICQKRHLKTVCPIRFGIENQKLHHCHQKLKEAKPGGSDPFSKYKSCLETAYNASKPCLEMFKIKCETAKLKATKTVRGTMDELDRLMENNPNMRIIHLVRDPRAVVVSRSSDASYRGLYAGDISKMHGGNKVHEAHIFCGTVVKDILHRRQLESAYPGQTAQVIYEDFIQNPVHYTEAIYKFLDEDIPAELGSWIHNNTRGVGYKRNARMRMNAWRSKLTYEIGEQITHECEQFYSLLKYKWPYNDM